MSLQPLICDLTFLFYFNRPRFDCLTHRRRSDEVDPTYNCFYDEEMRSDSVINFNFLNLSAHDVGKNVVTLAFFNGTFSHLFFSVHKNKSSS